MTVWQWDPSLYSGSADYYATGRMPYPPSAVQAIQQTLGLDGTGRLLDVGSGPGSLTFPLARSFAETVAVDADAAMVEAGRAEAESLGLHSISWHALRAEELGAELGKFRVVTFAQSFHWMEQARVANIVAGLLEEGGSVVHVAASTDKGTGETPRTALRFPQPPWAEIRELVTRYLGEERRAGQGVRPLEMFDGEIEVFAAAGFGDPRIIEVPHNVARVRTVKEVMAAVYSLSYSAPHLFGERRDEFDHELRELLTSHAASGVMFAEQVGSVRLTFWDAPAVPVAPVKPVKKAKTPAPRKAPAARKAATPRKAAAGKTTTRKSAAGKTAAKSASAEPGVPAPRPKTRRATKKAAQ
ncbi:class I SAM-dependent methyltransferase [Kineosporia babensis]